jgi:hypothetical protein
LFIIIGGAGVFPCAQRITVIGSTPAISARRFFDMPVAFINSAISVSSGLCLPLSVIDDPAQNTDKISK